VTNEEIWRMQRERRAHLAAVPGALEQARRVLTDFNGQPVADGEPPQEGLTGGQLRTLVKEVERLQLALKRANDDLRDEQREGQRAAGDAFSEGRHEGLQEARGY
jgi:hypothetical protein